MGNSSTKEQRTPPGPGARPHDSVSAPASPIPERAADRVYTARSGRGSRHDLSFLGIGSSSTADPPEVRRETKQEREARKLEKERAAREKERERSMKEEYIDGGYLVTQGVYTGTEDFSKPIVRQMMIERRIAPFWRGLNDFREEWTEHQLVAAARGLPIPAADEIPPEDPERTLSKESERSPTPNLQHLMVPITSRSQSYTSDASANKASSNPASSMPSPTTPTNLSSPFRPRSKTIASLSTSSKTAPPVEMLPREIQLPRDPYVNGLALEAFLYKDATECPICFLYYPPYLNKTRCCDQPICSECFVQIKRPDPHPPEHDHGDPSSPAPAQTQADPDNLLVSEPANCPYCQQAEFGVTFEPPPFRRGLAYANGLGNVSSARSSSTSLNSLGSPGLGPTSAPRRRTTSLSANASTVITTDRLRPDWATKLSNARNHAARRAAAATALHTAAYLMGNGVGDPRSFAFSSRSRFGRSRDSPGASGSATPLVGGPDTAARIAAYTTLQEQHAERQRLAREARENGEAGQAGASSRRRSRMEDLEDMMMMEAIRLSLAAEEERKRREDKEAAKNAKKKEKADKKAEKAAEKAAKKGLYNGTSSGSASGSALSLSLSGNRRRGNSGSSAFLREAAANNADKNADKGKGIDRGTSGGSGGPSSPIDVVKPSSTITSAPSRQLLETSLPGFAHLDLAPPSPAGTAPDKPSHLRHMSNASSPASSFIESVPGSLRNGFHGSSSSLDSPNASGTHLGGTPDRDGDAGSAGTEPMFNFRSLAAMVGLEEEKERNRTSHVENVKGEASSEGAANDKANDVAGDGTNGLDFSTKETTKIIHMSTPEVTVTPVSPAPMTVAGEDHKQIGGMDYGRDATQ